MALLSLFSFWILFVAFASRSKPEGFYYSQEVQERFFRQERHDVNIQFAVMVGAVILIFLMHQRRERKLIHKFQNRMD